ncbi:MAG: hypothetical protein PUG48_10765 [Clostridia bacterium]|nr:hypothetical protein [Clostridia bacterium]
MKDLSKLTEDERKIVLAKRAYRRQYAKKNPDKIKRANDNFYLRQAEKISKTAEQA